MIECFYGRRRRALLAVVAVTLCVLAVSAPAGQDNGAMSQPAVPFWVWPVSLFAVSLVLGVLAVLGGVGGGVLYVPIVSGFFPFHLDFVRCAGLLVALSGAVAAGPTLLRKGLADLRLALPVALIASTSSIFGAMLGLALPDWAVQTAMGAVILVIAGIMLLARSCEYPDVPASDRLSKILRISGGYLEQSTGQAVQWKVCRTPLGMTMFVAIGVMAGMFGLGAGWANVPVLNLVMGAPLKLSVATSKFLLSVTDSTAAWVYLNNGAALPVIVVPSVLGVMIGSFVGVRVLARMHPRGIRYVVLAVLVFAGARSLLKGLGIWN